MGAITRLLKSLIFFLIKLYQFAVSPFLPMACRHIPTCSHYTKEAIELFGIRRGAWMGFKRICRCHPWGSFGHDPVDTKN